MLTNEAAQHELSRLFSYSAEAQIAYGVATTFDDAGRAPPLTVVTYDDQPVGADPPSGTTGDPRTTKAASYETPRRIAP